MKYFMITEEECQRFGIKTENLTRIWQWYGALELESDLESGAIKIESKNNDEIYQLAENIEVLTVTSDVTWNSLAEDMTCELETYIC